MDPTTTFFYMYLNKKWQVMYSVEGSPASIFLPDCGSDIKAQIIVRLLKDAVKDGQPINLGQEERVD